MTFRKDPHTARKVAIGSAIAGGLGYLAGVLTAPKSGKETRKDLADKAGDLRDKAITELGVLSDELKEMLKDAKDITVALSGSAKANFNDALAKAKVAEAKTVEVLKAVKKGEASDEDLNKAIKQAKLATKNLGKYLKN